MTLHYDVLDANNGDFIRKVSELHIFWTLGMDKFCPHGNPTKYAKAGSLTKIFRSEQIRAQYKHIIDIVVDFKAFPAGTYFSDAGFSLREIGDIVNNNCLMIRQFKMGLGPAMTSNVSWIKTGTVLVYIHTDFADFGLQ